MNFIQQNGSARTIKEINLRNAPSTQSIAINVQSGTVLKFIGWITDGENVNENSKWFKTEDEKYFWSGNVEIIPELITTKKFLSKPLNILICTQKFGLRPEFYKNYGSPKGHNGLDFRTISTNNPNDWKQNVYAVMDGIIFEARNDSIKGNYIRLNHPNGYQSVYLHLSSLLVSEKQAVKSGDQIGVTGNTGSACQGPHLHFGYRPINYDLGNGYMGYSDPNPYFIDETKFV